MMKKLVLLSMIAALILPAMAAPTNSFTDITYNENTGWFQVSGITIEGFTVTPTLNVRVTGAGAALQPQWGIWQGQYDLNGWEVPVYLVNPGQTFKIEVSYSGAPVSGFSKDLIVWEGDATTDKIDAVHSRNYSAWFSQSNSGSWSSSLADGDYYSALFQVNKTSDAPLWRKIALPFMITTDLDAITFVQSAPAVIPAPGAILLTGIGTSLVGWLRRRRSL